MPNLAQWNQMWVRWDVAAPDTTVFERLIAAYSEPHRKYHTLQHLNECFTKLEELRTETRHPEEVEFALWFHDAVYDTSARITNRKALNGRGKRRAPKICRLTRRKGRIDSSWSPATTLCRAKRTRKCSST